MPLLKPIALLLWLLALPLNGGAKTAPEHPLDLNAATATELMQLPRVGARTAARIVAFRRDHGPFQRPEDLLGVKGIGEKAFRRLLPHLTVGASPVPER